MSIGRNHCKNVNLSWAYINGKWFTDRHFVPRVNGPGGVLILQLDVIALAEVFCADDRQVEPPEPRRFLQRCRLRAEQLRPAQPVGLADKARDELRRGPVVDRLRRVVLLGGSGVQNGDVAAHAHGLRLIVGDKHGGQAERGDQLLELLPHLLAQKRVERGERLVKEDTARLDDDRPGEGDALLLSAGKLVGVPRFKVLKMDCAQRLAHSALQVLRIFLGTQSERDVFKHRHVRPERKILKHKAKPALFWRQVDLFLPRKHTSLIKPDLAGIRRFQPGDHAQQRRLAAAGGAEQRGEAAAFNCQVRLPDDLLFSKLLVIRSKRIFMPFLFSVRRSV